MKGFCWLKLQKKKKKPVGWACRAFFINSRERDWHVSDTEREFIKYQGLLPRKAVIRKTAFGQPAMDLMWWRAGTGLQSVI